MNKEEPANIYILYKSKIGQDRRDRVTTVYNDQISIYLTDDTKVKLDVYQITRMSKDKREWFQIVVSIKPVRQSQFYWAYMALQFEKFNK